MYLSACPLSFQPFPLTFVLGPDSGRVNAVKMIHSFSPVFQPGFLVAGVVQLLYINRWRLHQRGHVGSFGLGLRTGELPAVVCSVSWTLSDSRVLCSPHGGAPDFRAAGLFLGELGPACGGGCSIARFQHEEWQ